MCWRIGIATLALALGSAAAAAPLPAGLQVEGRAVVREVIDGDTLRLADGRSVRLVGILVPKAPAEGARAPVWPLAQAARSVLAELAEGREVVIAYDGPRSDRHNYVLAHLASATGLWLQGELVARGMARVYTEPDSRAAAAELLAIEAQARATRRGIWAQAAFHVLRPDETARHIDSFQLVEGKALRLETRRGRVYLNFGDDWRSDFTVTISPEARRLFVASGLDPLAFAGKTLRIRGWIKSLNGPSIEATHPEQIEVLSK
jgi:endonuclease YncB( thermonuclease family)